jgi:D-alanyl-D-alanine carboxypeptidase
MAQGVDGWSVGRRSARRIGGALVCPTLLVGAACSPVPPPGAGDEIDTGAVAAGAAIPEPTADALQDLLDRWTSEGEGGAVLAVALDGSEIRVMASGVAAPDGTPVLPGDGFRIGSVTKTVVATMILQLVDEGALQLDDEVARHVAHPAVPEDVTVRDLLGHASGIPDVLAQRAFLAELRRSPDRHWQPEEVLDVVASRHRTGGGHAYSNTNYVIAGLLLEAVSERPLEEELTSRIVDPLGLGGTYLPPSPDRAPIAGFSLHRPHGVTTSTPATAWETSTWAAGGLVSTAQDIATFLRALVGGDLLAPPTFAAMTEGFGAGAEHGLGVYPSDLPSGTGVSHAGDLHGFRAFAVAVPPGEDVLVLLVNADRDLGPLLAEVVDALFDA